MKAHTSGLKDALKTFPLQTNEKITFGTTALTSDDLINVEPVFNGNILKSMMKGLTIESTTDIPKDTVINYQKGILVNDSYEYLNFGNYVVVNSEKKEDADSYLITCYDKLVYSAVDYVDLNLTYPISIADYLEGICNYLGLTLKTKIFNNADLEIPSELYLNLGYKFRDVLDEISQATGTSICLDLNDQVELRVPIETNDTVDEDFIASVNAKFGEKYGPINSVVLSRSAESDNVYIKDDESIALNGLCELKISDNQIMNGNDRSDYLQGIADNVFGLEYYTNDYNSTGVYYYDFLDKYSISIDSQTYNCLMLNDDISTIDDSENIFTKMPDVAETDYSKVSKTDKQLSRAMLIVDKVNGEIDAKVSKDEIIVDLNLAIQDGQGVIRATGNKFILDADNCSIDEHGNAEFENAKLRRGELTLIDDGENASIQIRQENVDNKIQLFEGSDISGQQILFKIGGMTYQQISQYDTSPAGGNALFKTQDYDFYNWCDTYPNKRFIITLTNYTDPDIKFSFDFNENDIMEEDVVIDVPNITGRVSYINFTIPDFTNKIYQIGSNVERLTEYKSSGLNGQIFNNTNFTREEAEQVRAWAHDEAQEPPTPEDIEKYDFDGDGEITINDSIIMQLMVNGYANSQAPGLFVINYRDLAKTLSIKDSYLNDRFYLGLGLAWFSQRTTFTNNVIFENVVSMKPDSDIRFYDSNGNYTNIDDKFAPKQIEEFTSKVSFNESVTGNTHFLKQGNMCYVYFQGEGKTHSNNQLIATIPSGYRPSKTIFAPFVVNAGAYGELVINTNGNINVNIISSTSVSGRIYANFTYPL